MYGIIIHNNAYIYYFYYCVTNQFEIESNQGVKIFNSYSDLVEFVKTNM